MLLRPRLWRPRLVGLLVGLLLATWVLPGSALATTSKDLRSKGSGPPASVASIESCRGYTYLAASGQTAFITACLERLPGGVRAYFFFSVDSGTANFKGTLHTCATQFVSCRKSRDFWLQGVGSTQTRVATDWDCYPTSVTWYGLVRLLDIRFLPSGELHQGTGPYLSRYLRTAAC
jgi:hypothetical protein